MSEMTIPKDLTSTKAREQAASMMGKLQRQIGELQTAITDRDRIIAGLKTAGNGQRELIEKQNRIIEDQREALKNARSRMGSTVEMQKLVDQITGWQTAFHSMLHGLDELLRVATMPAAWGSSLRGVTEEGAAHIPTPNDEPIVDDIPDAEQILEAKPTVPSSDGGETKCSVAWCENAVRSGGLCITHYTRMRAQGDPCLLKMRLGKDFLLHRETGPEHYELVGEGE